MAVPSAYLTSTKNTNSIFDSMQKASVPQTFTYEFLKNLGFSSSSDRAIIPVLKAIGFLDDSGRPTELYREYKDPSMAGPVLANAIRNGYRDLYAIDTGAHNKTNAELAGMFSRLTDKGDSVTKKMASTFKTLASMANFEPNYVMSSRQESATPTTASEGDSSVEPEPSTTTGAFTLRHDVHVHLPLTTDIAVYDAIFKSLKSNLL